MAQCIESYLCSQKEQILPYISQKIYKLFFAIDLLRVEVSTLLMDGWIDIYEVSVEERKKLLSYLAQHFKLK